MKYCEAVTTAFHDGMDKALAGGAKKVKDATYKRLRRLAKYAARAGSANE